MKRDQDWWDQWFLGMAKYVSTASKDPSTRVGAVIVDPTKRVVSMGFNGFPRGVSDDERLLDRQTKYEIVCHAEVNSAVFAQRSLEACTVYVWPLPPCSRCASVLIQSGIKRVVSPSPPEHWKQSCDLSASLFCEAGVETKLVETPEERELEPAEWQGRYWIEYEGRWSNWITNPLGHALAHNPVEGQHEVRYLYPKAGKP